jgi:hypothetical protein
MVRKSTWILLAIFVLALAAAIYMDREGISLQTGTATPTVPPNLFADINLGSLSKIAFQSAPTNSGDGIQGQSANLTLQKGSENQWMFASLDGGTVDQGKVQQVISNLFTLAPSSQLDMTTPLDATGLNAPFATLTLTLADGSQHVLQIGNATTIGTGYYSRLNNEQRIIVLPKFSVEDLVSLLSVSALTLQPTETPVVLATEAIEATPTP